MPDLDEVLQSKLTALEKGETLESVLADLPAEAGELLPLLKLAASVRTLPQPELSLERSRVAREKVLTAARDATRPVQQVLADRPTLPNSSNSPRTRPVPPLARTAARPAFNWRRLLVPGLGLGAAAALFLGFIIIAAGLAIWLSGPRGAHAATLMDVNGQVLAASSDTSNDWHPMENGDQVRAGQRLRTEGASSVTLVFFEGSRTVIGSNADLTLSKVDGKWGNDLNLLIYQRAGESVNSVVPLKGSSSQFVINTPSGSASVRGTRFNVEVGQRGNSRFAVTTGKVLVSNEESEVFITSGQTTEIIPGETIAAPSYSFNLQGELSAIDGSTWTVAGVPFTVDDNTDQNGIFTVGAKVAVEGHFEGSSRIADSITLASGATNLSFTGEVQSTGTTSWQVSGNTVQVSPESEIAKGLKVGDPVEVTFKVVGGQWQAVSIRALADTPVQPLVPGATPDPNARPSLEFAPEEIDINSCENDVTLKGTLQNTGESSKDYAANVELGYRLDQGGEWVDQVEISPSTWPTIEAGKSVDFTAHITMLDGWQKAGGQENEIKLRVVLANETNRPDRLKSRLTATIHCGQEQTETPEPEGTETPAPNGTGTPEVTPSPQGTRATTCTGANPHPQGLRLADRYDVPYETIMGWFCQGFGFGEIDLAYSLSQQSGKDVASIFAMKQSGMGWGNIKRMVLNGQPIEKPGNGNGNDNGKDKPPKKKP